MCNIVVKNKSLILEDHGVDTESGQEILLILVTDKSQESIRKLLILQIILETWLNYLSGCLF